MTAQTEERTLEKLTGRLVAALREETVAHERIAELLIRQEESVRAPKALREATLALEAELARTPHRTGKRDRALDDLARHLGIARSAMTLGSLCERLATGGDAPRDCAATLRVERERLRAAVQVTQKRTRRVNALVRMHREVAAELLSVVLGQQPGEDVHAGGTLIDAEG